MTDIRGLGYLRVQSRDLPRWRELTVEALGFAETSGPVPDGLYLRMDEREARLIVLPGDDDRVL
ncbi:2,3-dihydroxybiphenyl 1,2-dioxygenase, partial [Amycolatopsis sp. NPDC000740]